MCNQWDTRIFHVAFTSIDKMSIAFSLSMTLGLISPKNSFPYFRLACFHSKLAFKGIHYLEPSTTDSLLKWHSGIWRVSIIWLYSSWYWEPCHDTPSQYHLLSLFQIQSPCPPIGTFWSPNWSAITALPSSLALKPCWVIFHQSMACTAREPLRQVYKISSYLVT